jgi:glycerol-3-phosphate dehydrogenase (NAD(P)+)
MNHELPAPEANERAGVSILGAGGWGTALAVLFADRGMPVNLWGYDAAQVEKLRETRTNDRYLPGVPLRS